MQAIDLSVEKDYLPINLRDSETNEVKETLKFYYDDTTIKNFQNDTDKIMKRIEELEVASKSQSDIEDAILEEWFDYVLGAGSYDVVKKCQHSIIHRKTMLIDLSLAISKALTMMKVKQDEEAAKLYEVAK